MPLALLIHVSSATPPPSPPPPSPPPPSYPPPCLDYVPGDYGYVCDGSPCTDWHDPYGVHYSCTLYSRNGWCDTYGGGDGGGVALDTCMSKANGTADALLRDIGG